MDLIDSVQLLLGHLVLDEWIPPCVCFGYLTSYRDCRVFAQCHLLGWSRGEYRDQCRDFARQYLVYKTKGFPSLHECIACQYYSLSEAVQGCLQHFQP